MAVATEIALDTDKLYEVVDGQLVEKDLPLEGQDMPGARHGGIGTRLIIEMGTYVKLNQLGAVYGADTSFKISFQERMPDVSFISAARIPEEGEPEGAWPLAPDLAVEVISPSDPWEKVNRKLREYFAAGVREAWLISMEQRTVMIYHSPTNFITLTEDDELTSEALLPGFRCRISEIFKQPARSQPSA
jgi:Uma2 family endonuclease